MQFFKILQKNFSLEKERTALLSLQRCSAQIFQRQKFISTLTDSRFRNSEIRSAPL